MDVRSACKHLRECMLKSDCFQMMNRYVVENCVGNISCTLGWFLLAKDDFLNDVRTLWRNQLKGEMADFAHL